MSVVTTLHSIPAKSPRISLVLKSPAIIDHGKKKMKRKQSNARAAAERNKRRRKHPRKFKSRSVVAPIDKRWTQTIGYDKKRLANRKKRADANPCAKKKRRSHKAIHNNRHNHFTRSEGAHGIGIKPTRLEQHVRDMLQRSQKEHAAILGLELRTQPVRITPEFMMGVVAMVDGLREEVIKRMALMAAHRQRGRSKNASQKSSTNPSYMGKLLDVNTAWHTIQHDAKK